MNQVLENDRVEVISHTCIHVNLDAPPNLPFDSATIKANTCGGWVTLEKRPDGLYRNGVEVVLHIDEGQKDVNSISGHELHAALSTRLSLHPNELDAAVDYSLMPDDWKADENGIIRYILSQAVVYCDNDDNDDECIRYWCFFVGQWQAKYFWLRGRCNNRHPSALLAN
jgi:hypothetical protein